MNPRGKNRISGMGTNIFQNFLYEKQKKIFSSSEQGHTLFTKCGNFLNGISTILKIELDQYLMINNTYVKVERYVLKIDLKKLVVLLRYVVVVILL
jgi:hypothetical protein